VLQWCCCEGSACGCCIPAVLTFARPGSTPACPDSPDYPYTLTYGACPVPSDIGMYTNTGGTSASCTIKLTMPANSWWSPAITLNQSGGCPYNGSPVTTLWFWAYVATCVLYLRMVYYNTNTSSACPGALGYSSNYFTQNVYMRHSSFTCSPFLADQLLDYQNILGIWSGWNLSGTHGVDDICPDVAGNAGAP